jgi:signal transduction histidine kinase
LRLDAVGEVAKLPLGARGGDATGKTSEAALVPGVESRVRPGVRTPWHPRVVVTVAAAIAAVLLGVFGYVLANSQSTSRHGAEQRFLAQATIAAGLTKAIFSTSDAPQIQAASKAYGAATIDPSTLTALAKRSGLAYVFIVASDGHILATSPGVPTSAFGTPGERSGAIQQALGGQAWFSDLFHALNNEFLIEQAIPFPTRFGRRVEVLAYPAALLYGFLSNYLVGALPDKTSHGFVLDGQGRIVGSSVSGGAVGQLPTVQFRAILASAPVASTVRGQYSVSTGPFHGSRYVVAAPIGGSNWRVGLTEPTGTLYPADVGSQWWVIWMVFVAFAFAAVGCLYLLKRSLGGAARLVEQAHHVDVVNSELQATNAELNAFSYSVSHDLRAPLRAIDGFSRIVIDDDQGELSDSQRRYLGLVRDNTQVMGRLIDDLLSFSRLASKPVSVRTVQTAELVEDLEGELLRDQNGRTVEFVNGELPSVQADPALLRQVFANLLSNAVKYSRQREDPRITVDSEMHDDERVFLVRDNGVGFDMRYAEKLFQVFQRLHRAEDYEGTGVGLAIVQRIVTRHGGRVWAVSKPGEGATFYFTLNGGPS